MIQFLSRWSFADWSWTFWKNLICWFSETHNLFFMYRTSSILRQLRNLMSSYAVTFAAKILRNSWQNSFRLFAWTIRSNVESSSFIELIRICTLFEVKMIWCYWRILSSSFSEWKPNIRVNASTLMFALSVRKMILKLKSDRIFKYLAWRRVSCLFFIKIFNAWWSVKIWMRSFVWASSRRQCSKQRMMISSFLS